MDEQKKKDISAKIQGKKKLTKDERLWWLMNVRGHSNHEAQVIMAINDNKKENLLID